MDHLVTLFKKIVEYAAAHPDQVELAKKLIEVAVDHGKPKA